MASQWPAMASHGSAMARHSPAIWDPYSLSYFGSSCLREVFSSRSYLKSYFLRGYVVRGEKKSAGNYELTFFDSLATPSSSSDRLSSTSIIHSISVISFFFTLKVALGLATSPFSLLFISGFLFSKLKIAVAHFLVSSFSTVRGYSSREYHYLHLGYRLPRRRHLS